MTFEDILKPEIAFDGWAIGIILFALSCLGIGTYKYKTRTKILQKQKAGINSKQEQKANSTTNTDETVISQFQKAGDNSEQKQTL